MDHEVFFKFSRRSDERRSYVALAKPDVTSLPAAQLQPLAVLVFGAGAIFSGDVWLAIAVNRVSAFIALATCILYSAYTPLKTRTPLAGALPPLIG